MYLNLLNQMTFDDIRSRTSFIADYYVLKLMWKREYRDKEGSAEWQLSNNEGLIRELQEDSNKLYRFIKKHEEQIDKVAMLLFLHKAYSEINRDFSKEKKEIEKILKGIKSRYIYPERTENGTITTGLFRIDTMEVVEGKKLIVIIKK